MRKLVETGKGRTANKLRAYVSAAFGVARSSRFRADVPVSFQAFAVTINPADDTRPDERHNKPDKQPLNIDELRNYWQVLEATSGFRGAVLRLHLLGGGQRIEQLVRLKTRDIQDQAIVIYDGKGRPGKPPRPHAVPMIESAEVMAMFSRTALPAPIPELTPDVLRQMLEASAASSRGHGFDSADKNTGAWRVQKGGSLETSQNGMSFTVGDIGFAVCWNTEGVGGDWYPYFPEVINAARQWDWGSTDLFPQYGMSSF